MSTQKQYKMENYTATVAVYWNIMESMENRQNFSFYGKLLVNISLSASSQSITLF